MKSAAGIAILSSILGTNLTGVLAPQTFGQQDDKAELPAPASLRPVHLSNAKAEKLLIHRVEPTWQGQEVNVRIAGTVVLVITVAKNGHVESAKVISGHPMLLQAVLDAVKQWEYRPYLIDGKPVEFSTRVSVVMSTY